jgi:hypothetical protein
MARTSFAGPVYSEGRPVVTQDLTTGELVGQIPIVYPSLLTSLALEGEYRSDVLQTGGPALDVPRTVSYGPGGVSLTGFVDVAADGTITALKNGAVVISTRLRAQRVGAAGVSILVIWGEMSVDGGINWTQMANLSTINLDVAADTSSFVDLTPVILVIGRMYRIRFARSSDGNNSGDLRPQPLPGALSFLSPAPSAMLSIYRFA